MAGSIKIQHGGTASTPQAGFSTLWTSSADGEFYYTKSDGTTESLVGPQGPFGPTGIGLGLNSKSGSFIGGTASGWVRLGGIGTPWIKTITFDEPFLSNNYTVAASFVQTPSGPTASSFANFQSSITTTRNLNSSSFDVLVALEPQNTSILQWTATAHGETAVFNYGDFCSTATQPNAGATAANVVTYDTANLSSGVSVVSSSRITMATAGVYDIQFSAQFQKSSGGDDYVDLWLSKNGANVPNTNTTLHLTSNPGYAVGAWNFLVSAASGDYFELYWHSADTTMELHAAAAGTNPTRPAIPSVILTATQVSS